MPEPLVPLSVIEVRLAVPAGPGVEAGMVVLAEEADPQRRLRIVVGRAEALAIDVARRGEVPPRPLTWDLMLSAITVLEGAVERAVITAVEEERHWYGAVELVRAASRRSLACRPSDAIALALRAPQAGIFTYEHVLEAAGVLADGSRPSPRVAPDPGEGDGVSFT